MWFGLYLAAAFVVGAAHFLLAEFRRSPGHPAPQHPGLYAVAAGLLWPVLLVAAAQYGLIVALWRGMSRTAVPPEDVRVRIAQRVG